jgi:uncharacterized protein YjbJ (UPF0337 family)
VSNLDEAKGRAKEAVGDFTGDKGLKREGKVDRAVGGAKATVDKVADKAKDLTQPDDGRGRKTS